MKKLTVLILLSFSAQQTSAWFWDDAIDFVENKVVNPIVNIVKKPIDNFTNQINHIKNTVNSNKGGIETEINNYIIPSVNQLSATVSNGNIAGNIKVLEQSAGKIEAKINAIQPPQINLDNLAALNLQGFFDQINEVYAFIQMPLKASANIIHTMYTSLSYASEASTHAGRLSNYARNIVNAFNFSPVNGVVRISDMSNSLNTLVGILESTVPATLQSVSGASQNMSAGFENLYKNIGNTLHALETQMISLQKAAIALHKLSGNPPPPPVLPTPPPPALPSTISQTNNGALPPPPPPPPGWN